MNSHALNDLSESSHIGHAFYKSMKRNPDGICQIDAAMGQKETNSSVLFRTIGLAKAMRKVGLQAGDVLAYGGKNHLDLHIPYYAGLLNGFPTVGVDPLYKHDELKSLFKITQPKIAFCSRDFQGMYESAARDLDLDLKIVTYEDGDKSMKQFLEEYSDQNIDNEFKVAEFDTDKIYALLVSTSGTSNIVKVAAFKHKDLNEKVLSYIQSILRQTAPIIGLNLSPVQWISGVLNAIAMPIMHQVKLQTSKPDDIDHIIDIINRYKPHSTLISPSLMISLMKRKDEIDLRCFKFIIVSGAKINQDVVHKMREHVKSTTLILETYGLTETLGPLLAPNVTGPRGSCGSPSPTYHVKLVDPDTGVEIEEPYIPGELLAKGLLGFSEYLNNEEETKRAFSEDGYIKSGDLMYRDENDNFFFVERIKMMIKYRNAQVVPSEVEDVILQHPGVLDVCVVGIPHPEDGQQPAACVVRKPGSNVTAQEIKELVSSKLSKSKELCRGVTFVDKLPMTSTGKTARGKIMEFMTQVTRE